MLTSHNKDFVANLLLSKIIEHRKLMYVYIGTALLIILLSVIFESNPLPLSFSLLTILGVFLNSIFHKSGQLFFSFAAIIYIVMAYNERFYGEVILYIGFSMFYMRSFILWKNAKFRIQSISFIQLAVMGLLLLICTPAYYFFLFNIKTSQIFINSISTLINCLAVYCTVNKIWQQFYFWILINFIQAFLWITTFSTDNLNNLPILILNMFLFIINIYNLLVWKKEYFSKERRHENE